MKEPPSRMNSWNQWVKVCFICGEDINTENTIPGSSVHKDKTDTLTEKHLKRLKKNLFRCSEVDFISTSYF